MGARCSKRCRFGTSSLINSSKVLIRNINKIKGTKLLWKNWKAEGGVGLRPDNPDLAAFEACNDFRNVAGMLQHFLGVWEAVIIILIHASFSPSYLLGRSSKGQCQKRMSSLTSHSFHCEKTQMYFFSNCAKKTEVKTVSVWTAPALVLVWENVTPSETRRSWGCLFTLNHPKHLLVTIFRLWRNPTILEF